MGSRYAVSYTRVRRFLAAPLGIGPARSGVDVGPETLEVWMGYAFKTHIPRGQIVAVAAEDEPVAQWGVHGWAGRWLVNGTSRGIVRLDIDPPCPAKVAVAIPVKLRTLRLSLEDPHGFVAELER